jgi:hypothetical protein
VIHLEDQKRSKPEIETTASNPGVVRRAFYCDESGISTNQKHYGFGALVMGYQRRGEFVADMKRIRGDHPNEIKWNKCSRSNLGLYKELVDYFFKSTSLAFHCIVVERAWVNTRLYHDGSYDLARRKHFTKFLTNKVAGLVKLHKGRDLWTRVYADRIPSTYAKARETIEIIANRAVNQTVPLAKLAEPVKTIDSVIECDSEEYDGIQLCDLILGAVIDTWNESTTSSHKAELKRHIAGYVGWPDLKSDTRPSERKFNIWWLTDQIKPGDTRPVETRNVSLRYPLPPRRRAVR